MKPTPGPDPRDRSFSKFDRFLCRLGIHVLRPGCACGRHRPAPRAYQLRRIPGRDSLCKKIFDVTWLNLSIRAYDEKIARALAGEDFQIGPGDCPLCRRYARNEVIFKCLGCPVRAATGRAGCRGTPWEELSRAKDAYDLVLAAGFGAEAAAEAVRGEVLAALRAERAFLAGLRDRLQKEVSDAEAV